MAFGFGPGSSMNKAAKENSRHKHKKSLKENTEATEFGASITLNFENKATEDELMEIRRRMEAENLRTKKRAFIGIAAAFLGIIVLVILFVS